MLILCKPTDNAFQPEPQAYPTVNNGAAFPNNHGVAISVPFASGDVRPRVAAVRRTRN
jgi:hypothetical protein